MIAIGEESGSLDAMLRTIISEHYDVSWNYAMKKLSDAIAPALTVGLPSSGWIFRSRNFFCPCGILPKWRDRED
jgi:hypothetical protein